MPRIKDLRLLPKFRDSWSYLYVEHCKIDKEEHAIVLHNQDGRVPVPCASLALLMLGPGTSITHAAICTLADSGCMVVWAGEEGIRFYAHGTGGTRSSSALLRQAQLVADTEAHLAVVLRMYELRFREPLPSGLTLRQIRGKEGARVRAAYARLSREYGVPWSGRSYDRRQWSHADELNRAISAANSCLYGLCHAAIVALGLSPALGFIHTGKQLSFVYDIADIYKVETTVPAAFEEVAAGGGKLESRVRRRLRDMFREQRLMERIVADIQSLLGLETSRDEGVFDFDEASPGGLWDPEGILLGGRNLEGEDE